MAVLAREGVRQLNEQLQIVATLHEDLLRHSEEY